MMDPELEMQVDELCNLSTVSGPSESDLFDIYTWIDSLEFSRPKRNITRDFSDGVLMAELIGHYVPKYIDIRNYYTALSKKNKENNWEHLTTKVFNKLGMKVEKQIIQDVINSKPGAIEKILYDLRPFIARRNRTILNYRREMEIKPEVQFPSNESEAMKSTQSSSHQKTNQSNSNTSTASSKLKMSRSRQRDAVQVGGKKSGNVPLEKPRSRNVTTNQVVSHANASGVTKKTSQPQNRSRDKSVPPKGQPQPRLRSQSRDATATRSNVVKSTPRKEEKNRGIESQEKNGDPELITELITAPFVVTTEEHALSGNVDKLPNNMVQGNVRPFTPLRIGTFGLV